MQETRQNKWIHEKCSGDGLKAGHVDCRMPPEQGEEPTLVEVVTIIDVCVFTTRSKVGIYKILFVQNLMQCKKCKNFVHVSSVCRQKELLLKSMNVKCCNCGGDYISEFPECPVRVKEVEVSRIRAVQQIFNVETVKS